jgi:7-cyano-7-deazaguanine synthase in queuosine biosynthesis
MSYLVAWSGGADSTAVLQHYAEASSQDYPVRAISIAWHPQLRLKFMQAQAAARKQYLKWAKARGYHLRSERMYWVGSFQMMVGREGWEAPTSQPTLWLSALLQVVGEGDTVLMGYIQHDSFWHTRHLFEAAFAAGCALKGVTAELKFPGEWWSKADVLDRLRKARVPDRCWFTCEQTQDGKPCGVCAKCRELAAGRAELAMRAKVVTP